MSAYPIRVLVVDDEASVRLSLAGYFEDRGWAALCAESAEEALETLAANTFDVAIVDIRLPGLDGNGLVLEAKKIQPTLKFLIYTGSTAYELPLSLRDLDIRCEDVLRKPLPDLGVMAEAVRRLVGRTA